MAYAALVSLMQNLDLLLAANLYFILPEKDQIESLRNELSFMKAFLEDSLEKSYDHEMVKELETLIRDMAYEAEDFIDRGVCARSLSQQSLSRMLEEIKLTKKMVMEIYKKNMCGIKVPQFGNSSIGGSSRMALNEEDTLVGFGNSSVDGSSRSALNEDDTLVGLDDDVTTMVDRLTGQPSQLQIISVVGMGGIGKTTLARKVYNDPLVVYHFYIRSWVVVSQEYETRDLLLGLLGCVKQLTDEIYKKSKEQLCEHLYRSLKGSRYLIVMDDMWSTKAWNDLKRSFPNDNNGSRIMLTSRLTDVAIYASNGSPPHCMRFLSIDESWKLLCEKVFVEESCPLVLVRIGMQIAEKCQGLPLAVVVVAGLLSKMSKTRDNWEKVADSVGSLLTRDPEPCLNILAMSYNHLPYHLKACFLYMGVFPEDFEIPVWRLIWLWIAEGFIQPVREKRLEDVAEEYLEDLIDRCLILVGRMRSNGGVKTCRIHDLLRDLCLREAKKENFLHVINRLLQLPTTYPNKQRRLSFNSDIGDFVYSKPSLPLTRSFMCFGMPTILPSHVLDSFFIRVDFRLLRVLDIAFMHFGHFPIEIILLVHLRYLAIATSRVPPSIVKLWNLQTLIVHCNYLEGTALPREIWEMQQLRHLCFKTGSYLPFPFSGSGSGVLPNLQTLSTIRPENCTQTAFVNMPNLKKLGIGETQVKYSRQFVSNCLKNISYLHQLEALKCYFNNGEKGLQQWLPNWDNFPPTLK